MSSNNINNIFSPSYQTQQIMNIMKGGVNYSYKADSALSKKIDKDTLEKQGCTDGKDDGKITFGEKVKNFAKGIIAPVTTMFKSPKNFLIGAGMIAGTAALIAATGGAAAPVLAAAGVIGGGIQIGINANKAKNAATDIQAKEAWQGMGTGTTAVVGSAIGAKSALKASGSDTSKMGIIKSTFECIKQAPANLKKSVDAFKTGAFITNLRSALHIKSKTSETSNVKQKLTEEQIKTEAQARTDAELASQRKAEISQEAYKQRHEKNLSHKSAKESADVMQKAYEEQIKTEAQARTDAELASQRKAEISQEVYKQRHEKNLSHKSAKESADVLQKAYEEQIKTEAPAAKTAQSQEISDVNKKIMETAQVLEEEAKKGQEIVKNTPDTEEITKGFLSKIINFFKKD
ncbi:MAG: hypothetical protein ACI37R_03595 [Candidatus Avigastranaerophilus sp.]